MQYVFKYKRKWLWKSEKVVGHKYIADQNKMCLYYEDGSLREIKDWSKHEVALGIDWVQATKKRMENAAGAAVPLSVGK